MRETTLCAVLDTTQKAMIRAGATRRLSCNLLDTMCRVPTTSWDRKKNILIVGASVERIAIFQLISQTQALYG